MNRALVLLVTLLALGGGARAQEGGATLKDQVWGRTVAEAAGVAASLARKETVDAPRGSGVAVDLQGLSARRLRFATPEDALAWGQRAGGGRGLVLIEVRERQVVVLRGAALEEADKAARLRAAAWEVLRAPDEPTALLAAARDGVLVRSGEASAGGPGQAVASWLAQVERTAAAPRRALVYFKAPLRAVGDVVRHGLDPIPGGFWYCAIDGPDGSDLDLRVGTEEERWQSQTPASYEEVLAPADRPLQLLGRLSGGAPCEAVVAAIPVAAAEPVATGKPVMAAFDRQTLPRQVHALEPHPVYTLVRLAPRGPGGDLDLVLHGPSLRPVAASRGPTSDEALVVPPALGESGRRWLVVSGGRGEKRGEARPPAPYTLTREPISTKGALGPVEPLAGALEARDESWWATLRPQSTGILSVHLDGPAGNDLDLAVFGPNGECRMAASFDATEEVAIDARSETDYLLRVTRGRRSVPGAARFSLSLESLALDRLAADSKEGPRLWTIVVGVASYERSTDDLSFTRSDALTVYSELRKRAIPGTACVEPARAIVLLDDRATVDNVRRALQAIAARADPDDTVLFFFSGHGVSDLPDGARGDRKDEVDGKDEAICTYETGGRLADDELAALLDALPARQQLVILDACHSGGFAELVKGHPGRVGIFSSLETQTSAESRILESGALTAVMVACLIGDGDKDKDGQVTVRELGRFVERQLPNRCVTCLSRVGEGDKACRGCRLDLTQPGARQRPVVLVDGIEGEVPLGNTDATLEGAAGKEK